MERGKLGSAPTTANGGCGACGNITPTCPPVAFFRSRPCLNQRSFVRIYRTASAYKPAVAHPSASSWWKTCLVFESIMILIKSKVEILGGRTRRLDQRRGASFCAIQVLSWLMCSWRSSDLWSSCLTYWDASLPWDDLEFISTLSTKSNLYDRARRRIPRGVDEVAKMRVHTMIRRNR